VKLALVDHGAGNLVSIAQALRRAGSEVVWATQPVDLSGVSGIVLPGVGATAHVMDGIRKAGLEEELRRPTTPMLGICVGMQVLFEGSDEDNAPGLDLIKGRVRRLLDPPRLPHIGWNELELKRPDPLLEGIGSSPEVYFVHSYAPVPTDRSCVVATSNHGQDFVAAVRSGSITGVQFHPERSGTTGTQILANFVNECRKASE